MTNDTNTTYGSVSGNFSEREENVKIRVTDSQGSNFIQGDDFEDDWEGVRKSKWDIPSIIYLATICAAFLGSFQYGWGTSVIVNIKTEIIKEFPNMDGLWGVYVAMFALGGMAGGVTGGFVVNRFGRKAVLLFTSILFISGNILNMYALNISMFIIGRLLIGVGSGLATVAVPVFIAEIAPTQIRGALGVFHQLAIVLGIFFSELTTVYVKWESGFLIGAILCAVVAFCFVFFPETPSYLLNTKNKIKEAADSLYRYRQVSSLPRDSPVFRRVEREFDQMRIESERTRSRSRSSSYNSGIASPDRHLDVVDTTEEMSFLVTQENLWKTLLTEYRRPLLIGCGLQLCQQISGINIIFSFSTAIFQEAGMTNSQLSSALVAGVNVVMTLCAVPLMDFAGRRLLLLIGFSGMTISYLVLSFTYKLFIFPGSNVITIIAMISVVTFFAVGPGPVPWLIVAEIFPIKVRSKAATLCTFTNWLCFFIVVVSFDSLSSALGAYTFIPFFCLNLLFTLFIFKFVLETKGLSLDQASKLYLGQTINNNTEQEQEQEEPLLP